MQNPLLQPEDSKRVADALIAVIRVTDIQGAVFRALDHALNSEYHERFGDKLIRRLNDTVANELKNIAKKIDLQ